MDFALPPELRRLRDEATELALQAARSQPSPENSWIVGQSAEFAKLIGDRGWIGMTWPREEGGQGRSALERFVVYEALIEHGAPIAAMWLADRQMGPTLLRFGHSGATTALPSGDGCRHVDVVHRHERARCRF